MDKTENNPIFVAWHFTNDKGNLTQKIKKVKVGNKSKMQETHNNFHKKYKQPAADGNLAKTFYLRTDYGALTRMDRMRARTEADRRSSSSSFTYSESSPKSSGIKNKMCPRKKKTPEYNETDSKGLISFYYMSGKNQKGLVSNLNKVPLPKTEKVAIMSRFKINREVSEDESEAIRKTFSPVMKDKFSRTMERFGKAQSISPNYYFANALKSSKKLKVNSQIYNSVINMRKKEQKKEYTKVYKDWATTSEKLRQMPRVKKMETTNIQKFFKKHNEAMITKGLLSNTNESEKSPLVGDSYSSIFDDRQISRDQLLEDIQLEVGYTNILKNKPSTRADFTLSHEGNSLVLFGGINGDRFSDVWTCDLRSFKWTQVAISEENEPVPRSGHTVVAHNKELYIYGGMTARELSQPREDILILSLLTHLITEKRAVNKNEVPWRRKHVAFALGIYMVVHGGLDEFDNFLSSCHMLNLNSFRWFELDCKGHSPPVAYHSAQLVLGPERRSQSNFTIYSSPDVSPDNDQVKRIRHEGVYIFGGVDENRNYLSDLRILKVGRYPNEWFYPRTSGKPPAGRINASLNFYPNQNLLLLHGGRNDKLDQIFFDIFVLDLETMNWIQPRFNLNRPQERTGHQAVIYKDRLLILGGSNAHRFHNFDFCIINLDFYNKKLLNSLKLSDKVSNNNLPQVQAKAEQSTERANTDAKADKRQEQGINLNKINISREVVPLIEKKKLLNLIKLTSSNSGDS